jgi:mannosyltransferase
LFAVAVSAAGAARPSLWFDEAATISAATRPLPGLWRLLDNIDAVHGLYYLVMHGWFAVFPATEFWSRLPSCLFVGVAAAGVVTLGRQFGRRTMAVTAGIVFAILPRITWAGIEARPYALSTVAAVWLTVLLISILRRDRAALWPLYAVGLAVSTVLNVFLVLIVLAHAVAVAILAARRSARIGWSLAVVTAMAGVTPFLLFCRSQIVQVQWISPLSGHTAVEIAREQYFDDSVVFAILAAAVVSFALMAKRFRPIDPGHRDLALIATAWMVLPTVVLLAYSALLKPIYYPRYLCFTAPGMALLLAVCIVTVARRRDYAVALLALFALAATPNYLLVQRGPYAKEGMDYSQVADVITQNAAAGDCLILDNTAAWKPGPIRPVTAARPGAYAKLVDPGLGRRATERNWLWDRHVSIFGVVDRVRHCPVLWTVSERDRTLPDHQSGESIDPGRRLGRAPAYQVPHRLGFKIVERWQFSFAQVVKSTR